MPKDTYNLDTAKRLTEADFSVLSSFIQREYGIKMPPAKRTMLESRLFKRLRISGFTNFSEYCDYVFSPTGRENELVHMIDAVTTNKTDFFREPSHFKYLTEHALPALLDKKSGRFLQDVRIWSAGCSTGEEPYTLAMVLAEAAEKRQDFQFSILGTDISSRVLECARSAIYDESRIIPVPGMLKKRYLLKSKDRSQRLVRIIPELRSRVQFQKLNLMDDRYAIKTSFDCIFCRNVLIYFERPIQQRIIERLRRHLKPGGFLFVGHSETLFGFHTDLRQVAPTIYRMTGGRERTR